MTNLSIQESIDSQKIETLSNLILKKILTFNLDTAVVFEKYLYFYDVYDTKI